MTGVGGSDRLRVWLTVLASAVLLGVAGCDGDDGDDGARGPAGSDGDTGLACWDLNENGIKDFPEEDTNGDGEIDVLDCRAPGAGGGLDLSNPDVVDALVAAGEPIVAVIDSIAINSAPVVDFRVTNAAGSPLSGLPASAVSFTLVKLLPAADGEPKRWQSYLNSFEEAETGTPSPNLLERALQAGTDSGGTLVDNGGGRYTYTFATDVTNVTDPVEVSYEPSLTHRVGLEIRINSAINPDNPTLDFVPDGTAGSGTKDIAATASCNSCHERLSFHGGGRFTSEYCSTCHNPGTRDQDYAELLDLAHMAHALHASEMRAAAESAEGEYSYIVYGFGERFGAPPDDFSKVTYPQEVNYCTTCHVAEGDDATPDGGAWNETVTAQACGGCHVDGLVVSEPDENGLSTYEFSHPFGQFSNFACLACHISNGAAGETAELHLKGRPLERELGLQFVQTIIDVQNAGPGESPVVTYQYTDLDGNPYDVLNDPEFDAANGADLNLYVAWTTADYYNGDELGNSTFGRGLNFRMRHADFVANSTDNNDGTFTLNTTLTLPQNYTGDVGVFLNSEAAVEVETSPGVTAYAGAIIPVTAFYPGTERAVVVDNDKCSNCHEFLVIHGRRNDVQFCGTCHNGDLAGDIDSDGTTESVSMVYLGHAIHAAQGPFSAVTFPGRISNCLTCHEDGTFYEARSTARAISTVPNDPAFWNDDVATSTTAFACATCHSDETTKNHMAQNGGLFDAAKTQPQLGQETCVICHGEGSIADVAEVHNLK
jgi:OmcA/MtrC family decaheme c-type cytochrome